MGGGPLKQLALPPGRNRVPGLAVSSAKPLDCAASAQGVGSISSVRWVWEPCVGLIRWAGRRVESCPPPMPA